MNPDSTAPRYATLRDYLRVIRQRRVLILVCTLVFAIAGFALSLTQDKMYRTSSALRFSDPKAVFASIAQTSLPSLDLPTTAIQKAVDVARPPISTATAKAVGKTAAITPNIFDEPRTSLVDIEISSTDPKAAAKWANEWALQAQRITRQQARAQFRQAAAATRRQEKKLGNGAQDVIARSQLEQRAATLDTAAAVVDPADVVRTAAVPTTPYAPDRARDVLVGLILGLTIGIVAAFVRDALDRRLRRPLDIESDLHTPVLGHIYSGAMRNPPFVVNGRKPARQLLPVGRRGGEDATLEGFQILRTNLEAFENGSDVSTIMVTSAMAGEGKSSVSLGLAGAAVLTGRMTLLVECDLRRPSLSKRLDILATPGLGEYLSGSAGPADVLRVVSLAHGDGQSGDLVVIPAGAPRDESARLIGSDRFLEFLEQVRDRYDVVILDTGPVLSVADPRDIARHADAVLLCVRAAHTTREQARAAKAALDQVSARPAGVVVTDVRPSDDETLGYYAYGYST